MNRLNRRARKAAAKGCHAFPRGSWPIYQSELDRWDVYIEREGLLGPRGLALSKRQAVALAYSISVAKRPSFVITTC